MPISSENYGKSFALRLALLVAIAPFAVDTYLPAMPTMADFFDSTTQQVATSVSLFLLGFALGQLFGGPWSDRIGRRPVALTGLCIYLISSIGISISQTLDQLWILRFLQAIGGGCASVVVGAMVRDVFDGQQSALLFSMIAMIMMTAPLIAPGVGAVLLEFLGWQSIFVFLSVYAGTMLVVVFRWFPETRNASHEKVSLKQIFSDYAKVLTHRNAMAYILALAFAFSTMFVFITESAYIYIDYFSVSSNLFPLLFGANIVLMMLCNRINMQLLKKHQPQQLIWLGLGIQCSAAVLLNIVVISGYHSLYTVLPLIVLSVGSLGLIAPNATASALSYFPHTSGTANAIMGTSEFILAGCIGTFISKLPHESLLPATLGMGSCALLSLSALLILKKSN